GAGAGDGAGRDGADHRARSHDAGVRRHLPADGAALRLRAGAGAVLPPPGPGRNPGGGALTPARGNLRALQDAGLIASALGEAGTMFVRVAAAFLCVLAGAGLARADEE